ncbi:MAG: hypothetical protein ACXWI1_10665 [Croceibacterium sp.]
MRTSRILMISLLALPLGGCLGVTLPPQPLPDWAVNPQAQYDEPRTGQASGAHARKQRVVRQHLPGDLSAADSALLTGGTGAQPAARADTKPFAPGWDTREDERDASLRRTMSICRGC